MILKLLDNLCLNVIIFHMSSLHFWVPTYFCWVHILKNTILILLWYKKTLFIFAFSQFLVVYLKNTFNTNIMCFLLGIIIWEWMRLLRRAAVVQCISKIHASYLFYPKTKVTFSWQDCRLDFLRNSLERQQNQISRILLLLK